MAFLPMSGDLDDRAQGRDDPGRALIFRPHHPVGDEAETDPAPGIGKADLSTCAVMPETVVAKIAPRFGVELEANMRQAEGWYIPHALSGFALGRLTGPVSGKEKH